MLKVCNVEKRYTTHKVLNQISFEVEKGEIVGLLGVNGAGKSTLMNSIAGCIEMTSGDIFFHNGAIPFGSKEYKKHVGYVPEIPPLYPNMTVEEQLDFICDVKCIENRDIAKKNACNAVSISAVRNRIIKNLSKGYRQRVGIAQSLMGEPDLLILDEPGAGLDPQQIMDLRLLLLKLKEDHGILISSHILSEMMTVCSRLIIIHKGSIVAMGTPDELIKQYGTTNTIDLLIKGNMNDLSCFSSIEGVDTLSSVDAHSSECQHVTFCVKDGYDIREEVFHICSAKNIPILNMHMKRDSLEDIFMSLVK